MNDRLYLLKYFVLITAIQLSACMQLEMINNPWYFDKIGYLKSKSMDNKIALIDTGYSKLPFWRKNIVGTYNSIDGSSNVDEENGHGTTMLSLILGLEHDDVHLQGINSEAKIIVIKGIGDNGNTDISLLSKGIMYAADNNVSIISISLGTTRTSKELEESIQYALKKECIIVASAGDLGQSDALYPARYDGVIAVVAQDKGGLPYIYANDVKNEHVLIPGVGIDVPYYDIALNSWSITTASGSSVATAILTGLLSTIDFDSEKIDFDYLFGILAVLIKC